AIPTSIKVNPQSPREYLSDSIRGVVPILPTFTSARRNPKYHYRAATMRSTSITAIALLSLSYPSSSLADEPRCLTWGPADCYPFGGKAREAICAKHPGHSSFYQCYPTKCDPYMAQGPPGKTCVYVGRVDRDGDNTHYKQYCVRPLLL
ncbi:hypothetical protein Tdes44962_MAKER08437, partial [Teratosphaeria destructans]